MAQQIVERFMRALHQAEQTGEPEPLATLFTEDAELSNLSATVQRGREGGLRFWREYLSTFDSIRSQFTNIIEGQGAVALEWIAQGTLSTGRPISYRGISVLELDNDQVRRFRTYYDSAAFLPGGAKS